MSLSLLQGYSSAEDDEEQERQLQYDNSSDEEDDGDVRRPKFISNKPLFDPNPPSSSLLPSALDAFAEVAGPPQFLNNAIEEVAKGGDEPRHGRRKRSRDKKDLPPGAVVESKPQLVAIQERVRSDVGGSSSTQTTNSVASAQGGKRVATVSNPNAEDAAELLRMCLRCGVPKTYSNSRGIVCPVCGDRPPADVNETDAKKKGSAVKDKEKLKRMKGQSSHATWKSETEMQLRQQFD